jgi:excisionase family DNA binding protein
MKEDRVVYVSPAELAKELTVSMPTAYRLIYSGAIPAFKFGGSLRIAKRDLEKFIEESKRP